MKEYSEAEIKKSKAEVYCSSVERCPSDVGGENSQVGGFGGSDRTDYGSFAEGALLGCGSFLPVLCARQVPFQSVGADEDCTDAPYGNACRTEDIRAGLEEIDTEVNTTGI